MLLLLLLTMTWLFSIISLVVDEVTLVESYSVTNCWSLVSSIARSSSAGSVGEALLADFSISLLALAVLAIQARALGSTVFSLFNITLAKSPVDFSELESWRLAWPPLLSSMESAGEQQAAAGLELAVLEFCKYL